MSTDWDVVCEDCGPEACASRLCLSDCRDWEGLEALVRHRDAVAGLAELLRETTTGFVFGIQRWSLSEIDVEFFIEHKGHRLRVRSEYGEYSDECNDYFDPAAPSAPVAVVYAGQHRRCRLPRGHDSPHGP